MTFRFRVRKMPRMISFLPLIIVIAICFGCTQAPTPPIKISSCSFPSKAQVLNQSYYPYSINANSYTPPTNNDIQQNYMLRQEILDDLSQAFSNAPAGVQDDLCALTGVYIDTSSCLNGDVNNCQIVNNNPFPISWGFRNPNQKDLGDTYLAIPGSLWAGSTNSHAVGLKSYEGSVLNYFVQNAGNSCWGNTCSGPTYPVPTISGANPDASWATVLAALSHELGHVKLMVTIHPNATSGRNYKFDALQPCSIGPSRIPDFFSGWAYGNNPKKLVPKDLWRQFADQKSDDNGKSVDHSMPPYLNDFKNLYNDPNALLYTMYTGSNQPWANFWGHGLLTKILSRRTYCTPYLQMLKTCT
jgi:hypothetical protein